MAVEHTFCRICEAGCGLTVTTEGNQVVRIDPDGDHVAKGIYASGAWQFKPPFTVNGTNQSFDIVDLANPSAPTLIQRVSTAAIGSPNSVAVAGGIVSMPLVTTIASGYPELLAMGGTLEANHRLDREVLAVGAEYAF